MRNHELKKRAAKVLLKEEKEKTKEGSEPFIGVREISRDKDVYVNAADLSRVFYRWKSDVDECILKGDYKNKPEAEKLQRGKSIALRRVAEYIEGFYKDEK